MHPSEMGLIYDTRARWGGQSGAMGGWIDPNEQPNDLGYRTVWTFGGGRSGTELVKNDPQTVAYGGGHGPLTDLISDVGSFIEDPGGSWWDAVEGILAEGGDAPSTPEEIIAPIVTPPPVEPPPVEPPDDPVEDIPPELLDPTPPYIPGGPAPPPPGIPGAALSAMPVTGGITPPAGKATGTGAGVPGQQNINALNNYYNLYGHLGVVGPGKYNALLE